MRPSLSNNTNDNSSSSLMRAPYASAYLCLMRAPYASAEAHLFLCFPVLGLLGLCIRPIRLFEAIF